MTKSGKVAVLDDEPLIGDIVTRALRREWEVEAFERPSLALAALEAGERYAVFLCDMMMPECSGLDVYEEVKRRWPEQAERIVIMSGVSERGEVGAQIREAGVRLVQKPFDLKGLRQVVAEVGGEVERVSSGDARAPGEQRSSAGE